jgi:low temperature requirement protein LtrA
MAATEFDPEGARAERRTAPVELLWDLVFAFAITRVTALLGAQLNALGLVRGLLALALVWWAWSAFVWATNAQDPDAAVLRAALLLGSALIFISGLALPEAYGSEAILFAVTYVCVRLLHLALYADASRRGRASMWAIAGFAASVGAGMALLLAGAVAGGTTQLVLWLAAAAIDYAGPAWLTRERLRGLQQVAVAHFAERYGLFIIICLGESVVGIGLGASGHRLTGTTVVAVALALAITIGLWWTYFDRVAALAEERLREHPDPVLAASDAYSYIHLLLVAGIIVFAVGARHAVVHPDEVMPAATRLTLCGGVALYLLGHAAFRLRLIGRVGAAEPLAACAALALAPMAADMAAWVACGLLALVLLALVGAERALSGAARPAPATPARRRGG